MKVFQIVTENINSARELKDAFTQDEWARIINFFYSQPNATRRFPQPDSSVQLINPDHDIRSELNRVFRDIGPFMDDTKTPTAWNRDAVKYNAALNTSVVTWPTILAHLEQHKTFDLPAGLDMSRPIGTARTGHRADIDRTPETAQEVAGWVNAEPNLDRAGAIEYFTNLVTAMTEHRAWAEEVFSNERNMYIMSWWDLQRELIPAEGATVAKAAIDRAVYGWLTTSDFNLNQGQ